MAPVVHHDAWKADWAPVIALVGQAFSWAEPAAGQPIERGAIWRYLEPLEFDCPLHYDPAVAAAHGHAGVLLPATALMSFALPSAWQPGEDFFVSEARDSAPVRSAVGGPLTGREPAVSGFFATDYEVEYLGVACAGDRLQRQEARLLSCEPRETRVGRGAFLVWETGIVNQDGTVLARMKTTYFRYEPRREVTA